MLTWNPAGHSLEENQQWAFVRAIEWADWPLFSSQPLAPALLVVFPWYYVLLSVVGVNSLWWLIRYKWVSLRLADLGVILIKMKWPVAIGVGIYEFVNGRRTTAVISALWPAIAAIMGLIIPSRANYPRLQQLFIDRLMLAQFEPPGGGQPFPDSAISVLSTRPRWTKIASPVMDALARALASPEKASGFVFLCEASGLVEKIVSISNENSANPDIACWLVSWMLGNQACTVGKEGELVKAKEMLEFALLIKPNNIVTWYWLALTAAQLGDCKGAVYWADRVLSSQPDPNSRDFFERSAATALTPEAEKEAAELLSDPKIEGASERMRQAMLFIKRTCGQKT